MLEDCLFLTPAVAVACECDLASVWVAPWTGAAPAFVTWSAGSDSGTVCSVVLIVADMVAALALLLLEVVVVVAVTAANLTSVSLTLVRCFFLPLIYFLPKFY